MQQYRLCNRQRYSRAYVAEHCAVVVNFGQAARHRLNNLQGAVQGAVQSGIWYRCCSFSVEGKGLLCEVVKVLPTTIRMTCRWQYSPAVQSRTMVQYTELQHQLKYCSSLVSDLQAAVQLRLWWCCTARLLCLLRSAAYLPITMRALVHASNACKM